MTSIYILKLNEGKYYVGKSNTVQKRYKEHIAGNGSAWTRMYKPISIHKIIKCESPFDEDKITKEYMFLYGIHNVRGGSFTEVELSVFQLSILNKEVFKIPYRGGQFDSESDSECGVDDLEPVSTFIADDVDANFWLSHSGTVKFN